MTEMRTYPHGVPCWVDTEQPDPEATRRFYGELFGWTFHDAMPADAPGSYWIATLDGRDVAAIAPRPDGAVAWNTYVAVDDVDASATAVAANGGAVVSAPADAGPGGRAASCADPAGASFRLWQARAGPEPSSSTRRGHGTSATCTPATRRAARAFYAAVFGWEADELDLGDGAVAIMWRRPGYGDHLEATVDPGIRTRQSGIAAPPGFEDAIAWLVPLERDASPAHWHVTFAVADRDESVAAAERLGASVVSSADSDWTRSAVVRDPQGAELTLSQFSPPTG